MKPTYDAIFKNASHKLYLFRLIRGNLTMFAATQILKTMFVSVLDYGNVFLTGINRDKLSDLQKLQNDAVRCCLSIKNPRDAHVIDLHEQLQLHLIDHRRTVQLLTCIKNGVENNFLPHTAPEIAILRNQALKTIIPIPRNDTIKKKPLLLGMFDLEPTTSRYSTNRRTPIIQKEHLSYAHEWNPSYRFCDLVGQYCLSICDTI